MRWIIWFLSSTIPKLFEGWNECAKVSKNALTKSNPSYYFSECFFKLSEYSQKQIISSIALAEKSLAKDNIEGFLRSIDSQFYRFAMKSYQDGSRANAKLMMDGVVLAPVNWFAKCLYSLKNAVDACGSEVLMII